MEVCTTSAADRAERLPPRTAAMRYWYAVSGARPATRYDVTVPGTEPITLPSCRTWYLSGGGPVAGRAQWKATELVVGVPAASPVGRSSGGLCHGAQISRPATRPTATTVTIAAGSTHLRRRRSVAGGAPVPAGVKPAGSGGTDESSPGKGGTA